MSNHNKQEILKACRAHDPNPEFGPGQYEVVYDMLAEEYSGFIKKSNEKAVEMILEWMSMGED